MAGSDSAKGGTGVAKRGAGIPRLYFQLGWRTAVAVAVALTLAQYLAGRIPDKYTARAMLLLSPLPFTYNDEVPGAVSTQDIDSRRVSFVHVKNIEPLSMPDYALLLTSEDAATRLLDKIKPLYEKKGLATDGLSAASVMGMLDLRHKTLLTTKREVLYQQVVELYVKAGDPDIAAGTANAWADLCIQIAQEVRGEAGRGALDLLKGQIESVAVQLTQTRKTIADLDSQGDVDNRAQLIALDHEESLQESLLKELKVSLNAAELVTHETTPEFKIASHAIPPAGPSGPDRRLFVLVAVFLAAIGAPVLFFSAAALKRYARSYEEWAEEPTADHRP